MVADTQSSSVSDRGGRKGSEGGTGSGNLFVAQPCSLFRKSILRRGRRERLGRRQRDERACKGEKGFLQGDLSREKRSNLLSRRKGERILAEDKPGEKEWGKSFPRGGKTGFSSCTKRKDHRGINQTLRSSCWGEKRFSTTSPPLGLQSMQEGIVYVARKEGSQKDLSGRPTYYY